MPIEITESEKLREIVYSDDWDKLLWRVEGVEGFTLEEDEHLDSGRWHEYHRVIIRGPSGKYYAFHYETGLTERQEGASPAECGTGIKPVERVEELITRVRWVES